MPGMLPVVLSVLSQLQTAPATSTAPATRPGAVESQPATATAPAEPPPPKVVRWHGEYDQAAEEARKAGRLLLVIYYDPDAPASQTFEEMTLSDRQTREFLAGFAAVKLNAAKGPGEKRFAQTGAKEAPLTQVFSPDGELLDWRPGCMIPAAAFRERLASSLEYWKAANVKPFDPAARWRAVQARLKLATCQEAVPEIDKLLKLPAKKLPKDVTPALMHLTRGEALLLADPKRAEQSLQKVRELAAADAELAGQAILLLADMCFRAERCTQARDLCAEYISSFPKAADVGRAYYTKAMVEFRGLKDAAAAGRTLKEFIEKYPDDRGVVEAKDLLDIIEPAEKKGPRK